jgi:hypothetical protein
MAFANRPNPYPFFDELRKTPVVRVANGIYVVTGYRELLTLAHDPRISSDMARSPISAQLARGGRDRSAARTTLGGEFPTLALSIREVGS